MEHDLDRVKCAIDGDRYALQELLHAEKSKLYRMAFAYVRNEDEAVEIFQQTVLKCIESIHQLKKPEYFSTWLTRICINESLSVKRKGKRLNLLTELLKQPGHQDFSGTLAHGMDVKDALEALPDKYKTALMLRFYQDLSIQDIANVLDCPIGTVKTNIHRGLTSLKSKLKGVYEDEPGKRFN
ncbi:sigma-70 family RNA polymerase sigma factor [Jeotgalibacillus sp. R-1-5s-1]|uniref:sigma-70 family RNA polymerase sigma factor n=1 Tax=Jeotgalibacillus sp. R-1-5s-1 TaxID=2555897 RepID=UPI001FC834DB|nr:sigma-70 family RNA polymerase sigma factor [Jeotgalibacillus sp. R-1-5s-1]